MRFIKSLAFLGLATVATIARADIELTVTPAALSFGSVDVASTASQNATIGITFDGNGALDGNANNGVVTTVSIINAVGGDFAASQACAGTRFGAANETQTCTVQVDCTPNAVGNITADLEVQLQLDNGSAPDVQAVALSCTGIAAVPPGPGPSATAIPTMGFFGLGLLSVLLAGGGLLGLRGRAK